MVLESVPNARVTLESGFTTVRDAGVYRALNDIALRDAINKGYIVGPRMFVAGAYITDHRRRRRDDRTSARHQAAVGSAITAKRTARGKSGRKFVSWRTTAWTTSRCFRPARC